MRHVSKNVARHGVPCEAFILLCDACLVMEVSVGFEWIIYTTPEGDRGSASLLSIVSQTVYIEPLTHERSRVYAEG